MLEILVILFVAGAFALLILLCAIDMKHRLLPNKYVFPFAGLGVLFHLGTGFHYLSVQDMALGALVGGGMLFGIRAVANYFYKQDTLGLGDVKLMAAAGIWLGPYYILPALTIGALAGLAHGLLAGLWQATIMKQPVELKTFSLPAGPGFVIGIGVISVIVFSDLREILFP